MIRALSCQSHANSISEQKARQICEFLFANKQHCDNDFVEIFRRAKGGSEAKANSRKIGAGLGVVNFETRED